MTGSLCSARRLGYRREQAVESTESWSEQDPIQIIALGNLLEDGGRFHEALEQYEKVVRLSPTLARAHLERGNALLALGCLEKAVGAYTNAVSFDSNSVACHFNMGMALWALGKREPAIACLQQALRRAPDDTDVHSVLGQLLIENGNLYIGLAHLRRVLEIEPQNPYGYNNIGVAYRQIGRLTDSVASYEAALVIDPELAVAHSNLLFTHSFLIDQNARVLLDKARQFDELISRHAQPFHNWLTTRDGDRVLRVGLVSGDLREHPVGYFLEGVLAALMSDVSFRIEICAYSNCEFVDSITTRLKTYCCSWQRVENWNDEQLARRIYENRIDILIDLSGHTALNRLPMFAWKPAPVQATWLGYFGTTGVAAVDYVIADPWTLPQAEEANFTEKVWRLPETRLCFTPPTGDVDVGPLPALTNGFITFGCFNHIAKMNDAVVALWARVLAAVPNSRLLLKSGPLGDLLIRLRVSERFAAHGISPERLILEAASSRDEYLMTYGRVDMVLDSFPFPGGTTTAEALWMGAPVLTLEGTSFLARQGMGLLMCAGLPEWVACDVDDYVTRATTHAGNLVALGALRRGLRRQVLSSPLFDAPRFARNFAVALRGMWRHWCEEQKVPR